MIRNGRPGLLGSSTRANLGGGQGGARVRVWLGRVRELIVIWSPALAQWPA